MRRRPWLLLGLLFLVGCLALGMFLFRPKASGLAFLRDKTPSLQTKPRGVSLKYEPGKKPPQVYVFDSEYQSLFKEVRRELEPQAREWYKRTDNGDAAFKLRNGDVVRMFVADGVPDSRNERTVVEVYDGLPEDFLDRMRDRFGLL